MDVILVALQTRQGLLLYEFGEVSLDWVEGVNIPTIECESQQQNFIPIFSNDLHGEKRIVGWPTTKSHGTMFALVMEAL